jgi:hypothetical protein
MESKEKSPNIENKWNSSLKKYNKLGKILCFREYKQSVDCAEPWNEKDKYTYIPV